MQNSTSTSRIAAALAAAALSTLLTPSAFAGCGPSAARRPAFAGAAAVLPQSAAPNAGANSAADPQIMGLWKVVFVSDGTVIDLRFDTIHDDGLQVSVDDAPTVIGNVCVGTWEKVGPRTYSTLHPTFIYDPSGTFPVGIFIETIQLTLSADGSGYTGTFQWNNYDSTGNLLPGSVTGTVTGTRISIEKPFPFPFPF